MSDQNRTDYDGGTAGTGTAQATEHTPVKLAKDESGTVKLGTWKSVPPNYTEITNRNEAFDALMNYNATELRELIVNSLV